MNEIVLPRAQPLPAGKAPGPDPCAACTVRFLSVCNAVGDAHLDRLASVVSDHRADPHQTFVVEGDPADGLFNITEGVAKVYKLLADGRQQITGFLFAGDFLGLSADERYAYSAEALTPLRYCRFPRRKLEQLLEDFPQMERRLLGIASNELAAAQDQMLLLGRKTAQEKVASFLLTLLRRAERVKAGASTVKLPMTRSDIADYLGLTTETVSRTVSQLKRKRVIQLRSLSDIQIVDRAALESMAEGG